MEIGERSSLVTTNQNQADFYDHFHGCLRKLPCNYNCPAELEDEWGWGRGDEYGHVKGDSLKTISKALCVAMPIFIGAVPGILVNAGYDCSKDIDGNIDDPVIPLVIGLIALSAIMFIGNCFCRIKHHIPSCHKYKTNARCWYDMSALISALAIALNTYTLIKLYQSCANNQGPIPRRT